MRPWQERYDEARRHVAEGRLVIKRQRSLIAHQTALGNDTTNSQSLLNRFEETQTIFEDDLERITKECH